MIWEGPLSPDEIAARMTGVVAPGPAGRLEAFLPSPVVQNHAAFLAFLPDGSLACAWFGGTIEGASDISIRISTLAPGAGQWSTPLQASGDPARSEQNPVIFVDPDGGVALVHTAQPAGNQDECLLRWRALDLAGGQLSAGPARELGLPRGSFVRAPIMVRDDGAWMMPMFRCVGLPGRRWTGSHDTSALAVSRDRGKSWQLTEIPGSVGSVHMTLVPLGAGGWRPSTAAGRPISCTGPTARMAGAAGRRRSPPTFSTTTPRSPPPACPTAASRCCAIRPRPRPRRTGAGRSMTSSGRAMRAPTRRAAVRRSGACRARRWPSASRRMVAAAFPCGGSSRTARAPA